MPVTLTINYAEVRSNETTLNADGSVVIEAVYVVGNKPASGPIVYFSHRSFQGGARGSSVSVTSAVTDSHETSGALVTAAIAAQEGLDLTGGDSVSLIAPP